ncbi:MAG: DUF3089 domain-containing protein [Flavobacteriales bacterium]|nr:DUF3089 domain-containing protein [Flavobacteriales bacterium]
MERNTKNVTEDRKLKHLKYIIKFLFYFILLININSCKTYKLVPEKEDNPQHNFDINLSGDSPNYSEIKYWVEHPEKEIHYTSLPKNYTDSLYNSNPEIDVFFVHPTLYFKGNRWNADIHNKKLNKEIGNSAIKNQASVFLGIANIYAPHYRQMHIQSYYDLKNGLQAFEVAYSDVESAFLYYWNNNNNGNKFIIAGHSQGTNHAERLLKDIIMKKDSMKNSLIISYLPGMPIIPFHEDLPPCSSPNQLDCYLSWRTLAEGHFPSGWDSSDSISCINPISWKTDTIVSENENHLGILFQNHKIHYPNSVSVYNNNGVVWIKPIKIPFARFYRMDNYHIADYNLFWINIRHNLRYRLKENGYD